MFVGRIFLSHRFSVQFDSVRAVKYTIANGIGDRRIPDDLVPHGDGDLGDDDRGTASDPVFQDFQQRHAARGIEGLESYVIENK